jgi:hypothetical protein
LEEVWLEWLLCKHEALSSNPTPTKNKISSLKDNSQSKEKKKKKHRQGENIFKSLSDTGLISRIYKELINSTTRKQSAQFKMGKRSEQTFHQRR